MKEGFSGCRPNERIATALVLEGNLGLRISDILKLRQCDIVRDGDRYRLEVVEQKTGKRRVFTVPMVISVHRKLLSAQPYRAHRLDVPYNRKGSAKAAAYCLRLPGL